MRPSLTSCAKALQFALTSKKGNKDFYKGTRTGNILKMKRVAYIDGKGNQQLDRQGRGRTWTKRVSNKTIIDESRLDSFVIPPGLSDTKLKPYVYRNAASRIKDPKNSLAVPTAVSGYALADDLTTPDREVKFDNYRGMNGTAYRVLREKILSRRELHDEVSRTSK